MAGPQASSSQVCGIQDSVAKQQFPYSWANGLLGSSFEVGMKWGAWREQAMGRDHI